MLPIAIIEATAQARSKRRRISNNLKFFSSVEMSGSRKLMGQKKVKLASRMLPVWIFPRTDRQTDDKVAKIGYLFIASFCAKRHQEAHNLWKKLIRFTDRLGVMILQKGFKPNDVENDGRSTVAHNLRNCKHLIPFSITAWSTVAAYN